MATSQTLQTIIAINAQANGFGQVGATLTELGTMVDGLSQQLIDFGKESWETYKDYEKSMHEAEVALSTSHGRNTKELAEAMDQLNAKATEWAATTIFHTDDVANAINQAAHAGWDLDDILSGIPVAMQLAQAGSMDLSDALTYITKSMAAFGVPFEEMGDFVDMWVYAANSSVGDVQDFGDAMKKMGATMRFTDSKEELFALIGLMHDMGESGSTAATLLRTSMMRIIAPSGVASKVMEQLGATDEEIREIREDASKLAALQTLEDYGFNAFKDNNQAKPMIQIYAELGEVLAEIAGGYDNITKNQTTLGILSTIFGTRGITGALDIVTALQNAVELRDKLLEGNATGYGEYAAETMMETAYGTEEIFKSKIERLKQVVGEELSGQVQSVMENVGGIVDRIAEMDEGKFSALVSGLTTLATAGPALLLAGGAFRLLGTLMTPAGGIGLTVVALSALATTIEKIKQAELENTFGDMPTDMEEITSYVHGLGEDFRKAYEYTDYFQQALGKAVDNYRTASSTFSSNIFSMMITGAKLTPKDLEGLLDLADQVQKYAQEALYTASSGDAEYWTQLFGGEEAALEDPIYRSIINKTKAAYDKSKEELEGIGKGLREAITSAFDDDGTLDEEEYNKILDYFRRTNDMVAKAAAEAQSEEKRITMRKWLMQAQTGSFADVNELAKSAAAERDALLQKENDLYMDKLARLQENGGSVEEQESARVEHERLMNEISANWDQFQLTLYESQLENNGQRENWLSLQNAAQRYLTGQLSTDEALTMVRDVLGGSAYSGDAYFETGNARSQLAKITGYMLQALGGEEAVRGKIDYYEKNGNTEMAERLKQFYAMQQLANGFQDVERTEELSVLGFNIGAFGDYATKSPISDDKGAFENAYLAHNRWLYMRILEQEEEIPRLQAESDKYAAEIANNEAALRDKNYGARSEEAVRASLEGYRVTKEKIDAQLAAVMEEHERFMEEYEQIVAEYGITDFGSSEGAYFETGGKPGVTGAKGTPYFPEGYVVPIRAAQTGEGAEDPWNQLTQQGVSIKRTTDATELEATIDSLDGRELTTYLNGDATDLEMTIKDQDGKTLVEKVTGDPTQLAAEIEAQNGKIVTVYIRGKQLLQGYAEGGRATEPSIFGEVPGQAEWAIPEQHSERTAELLDAARAASGFTWGELLARFGGLNANPRNTQNTIVYSPTINAQDASGVEQALKDDRRRFEKWFEDKAMRDAAEVYA